MSPEQLAAGESVDGRTDIYALGVVFYELLSGAPLFRYGSAAQAITEIPKRRIRPIAQEVPGIPEGLVRIVMKALEKEKQHRYPNTQALLDDLEALRRQLSITYSMTDLSKFMKRHFSDLEPAEEGIPSSVLLGVLRDVLME
jgi:serine/threonine protein kinase